MQQGDLRGLLDNYLRNVNASAKKLIVHLPPDSPARLQFEETQRKGAEIPKYVLKELTGDAVELVIFGKTPLGYKAIINGSHSGLLFAEGVFQELQPGERVNGFISRVRDDGKIDLSMHAPGRDKVESLEQRILSELKSRGGFWAIGDHSPADEIHDELGVSKRTFKQCLGALLKKRAILIEEKGIRIAS